MQLLWLVAVLLGPAAIAAQSPPIPPQPPSPPTYGNCSFQCAQQDTNCPCLQPSCSQSTIGDAQHVMNCLSIVGAYCNLYPYDPGCLINHQRCPLQRRP